MHSFTYCLHILFLCAAGHIFCINTSLNIMAFYITTCFIHLLHRISHSSQETKACELLCSWFPIRMIKIIVLDITINIPGLPNQRPMLSWGPSGLQQSILYPLIFPSLLDKGSIANVWADWIMLMTPPNFCHVDSVSCTAAETSSKMSAIIKTHVIHAHKPVSWRSMLLHWKRYFWCIYFCEYTKLMICVDLQS